jgi:hypothetical protein
MAAAKIKLNVCHRLGWLGKSAIIAAYLLSRLGITLPVGAIVWAVNHSSFVRVGHGPWQRMWLDLRVEDI